MPVESVTSTRALATSFHTVAIAATVFRLQYRFRISRLWWEDLFAALGLFFDITLLVSLWIFTDNRFTGPVHQPRHTRIVAYWFVLLSYTCVLWVARISILASIIRIIPSMLRIRTVANVMGGIIMFMGIGLLAQKAYGCAHDTSWYHSTPLGCPSYSAESITLLCVHFVTDVFLVITPLRLLWHTKLGKIQRRLVFTIFSSSFLTSLASIVTYVTLRDNLWTGQRPFIDVAVALIVCNLLVIVTYFYRKCIATGDVESAVSYPYADSQDGDGDGATPIDGSASHIVTTLNRISRRSSGTSLTSVFAGSESLRSSKDEGFAMGVASNPESVRFDKRLERALRRQVQSL